MNEEKFKCECGCEFEDTYQGALTKVFSVLEHHERNIDFIGSTCANITDVIESLKKRENISVVIESICSDIKKINDRLDKLEGKDNPSVRVCCSNDVKPV